MKYKKILIIIGSFKIGGAERMAINVGEKLNNASSYEVHYALQRPIFQIPNSIDKSRIHLLNKKIEGNKYKLHFKSFIGIFLLRLKLSPKIVIGFTYFSSFLACFTFCKNTIGRFDINPFLLAKKRHHAANFTSKWPFIRKIIVPSSGIAEELRQINPYFKSKTHVINNAIDFDQVLDMANSQISDVVFQEQYISAMGRLTHQKNFPLLLNAYSKSRIKEKFKLLIIGDGILKNELINLVHQINIEDRVIFTGFLKNPFPFIKNSKFFINTSDFESFCNVILEALALSNMVVASDCVSGPSEMIVPGYNGFLFEPNNEIELIKILDELSDNLMLIEKLTLNAVTSTKKFQLDEIGLKWERLFESL